MRRRSLTRTGLSLFAMSLLSVAWIILLKGSLSRRLHSQYYHQTPAFSMDVQQRESQVNNDTFQYPVNASLYLDRNLPVPMQVMEDYIRQHSPDAIQNDPHPEQRNYAIAFYQCPLSAGNNLHRFFNAALWSILTNRTLLVKYWTKRMCKTHGLQAYSISQCRLTNEEADCNQLLTKAPWMASYDKLYGSLLQANGSSEVPFHIPYHATMARLRDSPRFPVPDNYEQNYGVDLASKYPHRVVIFPYHYSKYRHLQQQELQELLLHTDEARQRVRDLFSLGDDFLYGMLHRYTFNFASAVATSTPKSVALDNKRYYTIGLHSRHRFDAMDGCDISREMACIQQLLQERKSSLPVQVRIMSDRPCTISTLSTWLELHNYTVMVAQHDHTSPSMLKEHGPYAGIGYFQDLALVSTAQSALVAMARSSSDVLRELMVFDQALELWKQGNSLDQSLVERAIDKCVLPYQPDPTVALTVG